MKLSQAITFLSLSLFAIVPASAQTTTVTFESFTLPSDGSYNGDTAPEFDAFRDDVDVIGTRDNFGATETLQLFNIEGASFFNGFTPDFGSFNGFAISNVVDTTTPGFENQFASFPGGGSDGAGGVAPGTAYAVAFGADSYFDLPENSQFESVDLANTTFAALTIENGDEFGFATPFSDGDFFSVTLTSYQGTGGATGFAIDDTTGELQIVAPQPINSIEIVLADFRNGQTFIQDDFRNIDLTSLGVGRSIGFSFTSTDVGDFGINTPTFVAIDNLSFSAVAVPEPSTISILALCGTGILIRRRRG